MGKNSNVGKNVNSAGLNECTSCGLCAVTCAKKCISIVLNKSGFYAPVIDETKCNYCGECTSVCYKFHCEDSGNASAYEGKSVIAAIDNDKQELLTVSSGGVGNRLANHFYNRGYKVCGVVFDPHTDICKHMIAQTSQDLERFKTSKYLQSNTLDAFSNFKKSEKYVVFGTPCQIFGLRKYIQKKKIEDRFLLVDFFCRGTPTLLLWQKYKEYIQRNFGLNGFDKVTFRDKSIGWHKFSMRIVDETGKVYSRTVYEDLFYSFFLKNTCFNKACYDCMFRYEAVYSDIRLGDFWGEKYYPHDEGVSLTILCTERGQQAWEEIRSLFTEEECLTQEIFKSQRFNKYPIYEKYDQLMNSLAGDEILEEIHRALGLDSKMFYKQQANTARS
jgi:coenzyme F420-reducing hydrogenase beta subunit